MTRLLLALIVTLISISSAWAVKIKGLYQAEIPVMTQTDTERENAVKHGFIQVLVKISGNPEIASNPIIKSNLNRATYFVQEYSYQPAGNPSSPYVLQIHYSKSDITNLLKKTAVTYWNEHRPLMLVWLAVTNQQDATEIIGNESPENLLSYMKEQGKAYGLPLIFPMMDVADIDKVTPLDVRKSVVSVLQAAGKRYSPDALLIGSIQQNKDVFASEWQLVLGNNHWNWDISGKEMNKIVTNVLSQVSQTLAKNYGVKPANIPLWVQLEIANITGREDLTALMQYLQRLTPVQQVELAQVSGDVVNLSVEVQGSLDNFKQNTAIGQRLTLKSEDTTKNKLIYDWVH